MPKPVCVKCHRFFRPHKTGFSLIEGMPKGKWTEPGIENDEDWQDYKLWMADLYKCEGCGTEIVVGFANRPVAEHYQDDFAKTKNWFGTTFRVNDC